MPDLVRMMKIGQLYHFDVFMREVVWKSRGNMKVRV